VSTAPWAAGCFRLAAMGCLVLGNRGAALRLFGGMLERWPGNAYALASRSHLLAQCGRRDEALVDARQLVALYPDRSASDWFNLAFLLEDALRLDEAEAAFRRCVALDPKFDRAWYGLGLTLIRLKRYEEALPALERNTELQPLCPYGWYQMARVHMDRHEPDATRKIIRHLKGFEPKVAAQLERETGLVA